MPVLNFPQPYIDNGDQLNPFLIEVIMRNEVQHWHTKPWGILLLNILAGFVVIFISTFVF